MWRLSSRTASAVGEQKPHLAAAGGRFEPARHATRRRLPVVAVEPGDRHAPVAHPHPGNLVSQHPHAGAGGDPPQFVHALRIALNREDASGRPEATEQPAQLGRLLERRRAPWW